MCDNEVRYGPNGEYVDTVSTENLEATAAWAKARADESWEGWSNKPTAFTAFYVANTEPVYNTVRAGAADGWDECTRAVRKAVDALHERVESGRCTHTERVTWYAIEEAGYDKINWTEVSSHERMCWIEQQEDEYAGS